jgi:hypothetical protein
MNNSSFRRWCQEKWFEHKDELAFYGQPLSYNSEHYFSKYKYWLKREYKHQATESK